MSEAKKLVVWAGIITTITLGVFFGTFPLFPAHDPVVFAAALGAVIVNVFVAVIASIVIVSAICVIVATVAAITAMAATIAVISNALIGVGVVIAITSIALAVGEFKKKDVSSKWTRSVLIAEVVIIFSTIYIIAKVV